MYIYNVYTLSQATQLIFTLCRILASVHFDQLTYIRFIVHLPKFIHILRPSTIESQNRQMQKGDTAWQTRSASCVRVCVCVCVCVCWGCNSNVPDGAVYRVLLSADD